jgi:hypothetical protein
VSDRRRCPPPIPGAPIEEPAPEARQAVLAAQRAEGQRINREWEEWHRAFGVMQRDPGRTVWGICTTDDFGEPFGPTPEAAVVEFRRRALNSWRNWAGMYPRAMTKDCYEVTEAIILGFPWRPFVDNPVGRPRNRRQPRAVAE